MIRQYNTPQNQATSVAQKAVASFLQQPIDSIACTLMAGGLDEATIVKCSTQKNGYIVKVFSNTKSGAHEIAWTRLACDLGIGPKLYYADPAGSYLIIEFVEGTSLLPITANNPATIKKIVHSISRLHNASAPFAKLSDMVTRIDAKYTKLHSSGKLQELLETTYSLVKRLETELQKTPGQPTPCHNDLNPRNIFIHHDAVTIIDWGDAALGNPLYDIAAFFILNAIEPDNEQLFFETYDAKLLAPKWQEYTQACKQMVRFEFALNLLLGVQENNKELLHSLELPQTKGLQHYLTLFAKQAVATDSTFLYHMALASLHEITRNHTMMNVTIREARASDHVQINQLYIDTIHAVSIHDYTQEQIDVWAPKNQPATNWEKNFRNHYALVAEQNGLIVGFGDITSDDGYLDHLFVHKDFQGQGIAKALFERLEAYARSLGISEIYTEASITAKPFFEKRGFTVTRKQDKQYKGIIFVNYLMHKKLN